MTKRFAFFDSFSRPAIVWLCLWLGSFAFTQAGAADEVPVSNDYVLRVWELEDGMPDHHVSNITRTGDGYLWFSTFSGLVRFDGVRFQSMGKGELPGLPSPWVSPVFAASDGSLWLGLDQGGMARWDRKKGPVQPVLPVQPRPTHATWFTSFAEDATGGVWFGSGHETKVFRWKDGNLTIFALTEDTPSGPRVYVGSSAGGTIWCRTETEIARFDGKVFTAVEVADSGGKRITRRASGGIWATSGAKLHVIDENGAASLVADFGSFLAGTTINLILEDHAGDLWIGTSSSGLFRFREGSLTKVATSLGNISALAEDDEGTLWVGTWGGGLNRLTPRRFFMHQPHPEAEELGLASICADAEGRIWTVDQRGVLAVKQSGPGRSFETPAGWQPHGRAHVVEADALGNVWIGTSAGLVRGNGGGFIREPLPAGVLALLADDEDGLWAATEHDVFHRGPDGFEALPKDVGTDDVRVLANDGAGRIWFGTRDGRVFYSDKGRFTTVVLPEAELDWSVRFILPEGDRVWIGTLLGGLYCWKDGIVARLPRDASLPLAEIRSLFIQPDGDGKTQGPSPDDEFWFGTAQGLFSTPRREIERRLRGDEPEIAAKRHGFNEGLPNLEFMNGGVNGVTKSPGGDPWFATNHGALEVRPAPLQPRGGARRVIIESAGLDLKSEHPDGTGGLELPPKPGLLRIRYTLPELLSPEQVRFRYRLTDGRDGDWNMVGGNREAAFAGLAPGQYHFEVAAAVGSGPWLPGTASMEFTVQPAWWQTLYFKVALIFALVAAVWSIVMLRAHAKIRYLRQQRAVERERTRIARDMHDEIGANLTHINAISRLALLEDSKAAAGHFGEIADTAKRTVDALDEIVWAVNPRYDSLAGTIEYLGKYAVRFLSSSGLECEVDLPGECPDLPLAADVRHHLLLVAKEALNNAVKHSRGTKAGLFISMADGELRIVIEDDGIGFSPDSAGEGADGLLNMRERMAAIGGGVEFGKSEMGGGRVLLRLPLSER